MRSDIRNTRLYGEAEALYNALRAPGSGQISDASELDVSPDGQSVMFAGTLVDRLEGSPSTRISEMNIASGEIRVLTFGPNADRLPRYSPDGRLVAFSSDRRKAGDFQLYLLDPLSGAARPAPTVDGWVEYLHWSPDGKRILLGVAGRGADVAGVQGAISNKGANEEVQSWMPAVETGLEASRWRRVWAYELATNGVRQISAPDINVWESVWCGNDALAAVISHGPDESLWYSACLHVMDVDTGTTRELYKTEHQLGCPTASPSGRHVAIVKAVCSDRGLVAGELQIVDTASGRVHAGYTGGADVSYTEWRSDHQLLVAGHRGFESLVGVFDTNSGAFTEAWASCEITSGGRYMSVTGCGACGDCVLVGEGFQRAPEIAVIRQGEYRCVRSFDLGYAEHTRTLSSVRRMCWNAPDGLEIQGWLLLPTGAGPYPLVMIVHGGPVWHWRPVWLGRPGSAGVGVLMLIRHGFAVFLPNPRGSTGRGLDFARRVIGDLGGADMYDCLSGIDQLVSEGIADARRLGITGGSYGGFMSCWLITQDSRFAAAVPVAPITNHVTERWISNIGEFVSLFLQDEYTNSGGKYFQRSPINHAHKVSTPTLNICGALDRCTPPEEAVQFHNALLANRVQSVLITYPEEGHGVRKWPAAIDFAARMVGWFEEHLSATDRPS
jgi:dipeptidyl aminopeptidase/acylaminoacyl peptidase